MKRGREKLAIVLVVGVIVLGFILASDGVIIKLGPQDSGRGQHLGDEYSRLDTGDENPCQGELFACDDDEEVEHFEDPPKSICDEETLNAGDGLYLGKTLGNFWLEYDAIVFPGSNSESNVILSYDSVRAGDPGAFGNAKPMGYGWKHSFYKPLQEKTINTYTIYYEFCDEQCHALFDDDFDGIYTKQGGGDIRLEVLPNDEIKITFSDGRIYRYGFGGTLDLYKLKEIEDSRGRKTTLVYPSGSMLLEKVVTPHGREILFEHTEARLTKITDPEGGETVIEYENGEVSSVTDPLQNVYSYEYDEEHRIIEEVLPNGVSYTAQYEEQSRTLRDSENNIIGKLTTDKDFPEFPRDPIYPGKLIFTDGREQDWDIWRNNRGQLTGEKSPNGVFRGWYYNNLGQPTQIHQDGKVINYEWDGEGRLHKIIDEQENVWEYGYDSNAPYELSALPVSYTRPDGETEYWNYDQENGDLLSHMDYAGNVITYNYETWNDMEGLPEGWTEPLGGRIKRLDMTTFDENGNSHITRYEFDVNGNSKKIIRALGELDLTMRVDEYDSFGYPEKTVIERDEEDFVVEMIWEFGRPINHIIDPNGLNLNTHFEYDQYGLLNTITNPKGIVTDYNYDHRNRFDEVIEASGSLNLVAEAEYDGENNVKWIRDANGAQTNFDYNEQNFLEETEDAEGYITHYDRDSKGKILRIDRSLEIGEETEFTSIEYTYDNLGRKLTETVDPDGSALTTAYSYSTPGECGNCNEASPGEALPYKIEDAEEKITYLHYDELNRIEKVISKVGDTENLIDSNDAVTLFFYNPNGNLIKYIDPEEKEIEYYYDAAYRLYRTIKDPDGNALITVINRDGADNPKTIILANGNVISYEYDLSNRPESIADSLGDLVSYTYTSTGQVKTLTDGLDNTYEWMYDDLDRVDTLKTPENELYYYDWDLIGQLIDLADPLGITTHYEYNNIGFLESVTRNHLGQGPTANTKTEYDYNGAGWLLEVRDNEGNPTEYEYDDAGRIELIRYPDGSEIGFGLNDVRNILWKQNSNNEITEYEYNDLHLLTEVIYPTRAETYEYDKSGKLLSASNDAGSSSFTYDYLGRVKTAEQIISGVSFASTFDYVVGVESSVTRNGPERSVTRTVDQRERLVDISSGNIGASFTYDIVDRLDTILTGNNIQTDLDFDEISRLTKLSHGTFFDEEYGYDSDGRRTFTENLLNNEFSSFAEMDELDRLKGFDRGTLNSDKSGIESALDHEELAASMAWNLDSRGNWNSKVEDGAVEVRVHNEVNELENIKGQILHYDPNGNLIEDPFAEHTYEYDEEDRLVAVRDLNDALLFEIEYDGFGRRIKTMDYVFENPACGSPEITIYVYDGLSSTEEYVLCNGQPTLKKETIPGLGFPNALAVVNHPESQVLYLHQNYIGSPIAVTDESGDVLVEYEYDPYGKQFVTSGSLDKDLGIGFTGQRFDSSTGLNSFHFRSYDSNLGRYKQRDPAGYVDGVSLYEYVSGSPMEGVDPLGLDDEFDKEVYLNDLIAYELDNNPLFLLIVQGHSGLQPNSNSPMPKQSHPKKNIFDSPNLFGGGGGMGNPNAGVVSGVADVAIGMIPVVGDLETILIGAEMLRSDDPAMIALGCVLVAGGIICATSDMVNPLPGPEDVAGGALKAGAKKAAKVCPTPNPKVKPEVPEITIIFPEKWNKKIKKHKQEVEKAIEKLRRGGGNVKPLRQAAEARKGQKGIGGGHWEIRTDKGGRIIYNIKDGEIDVVDFRPSGSHDKFKK